MSLCFGQKLIGRPNGWLARLDFESLARVSNDLCLFCGLQPCRRQFILPGRTFRWRNYQEWITNVTKIRKIYNISGWRKTVNEQFRVFAQKQVWCWGPTIRQRNHFDFGGTLSSFSSRTYLNELYLYVLPFIVVPISLVIPFYSSLLVFIRVDV